jgi:phenylacetate-CoA ligase
MKLSSSVLRNFLFPIGDFIFGQKMISRLKFLEKAQWWELEKIQNWQNKELTTLIQIAYKDVPFYRELFDKAGVRPEDIKKPQDLIQLPLVTKDMLRKGYPHLTTRPTGQRTYEASTAGSTGKNFYIREDAYTAGWYRATFLLALEWAGWSMGEPHIQTGMTLQRSFDRRLKDWLLGCHYVSAYTLDDKHLDAILFTMEKYRLQYLWGYPGSLYYLAIHAKKRGWNRPLRSTVTWGDMLYPNYRKVIEEAFHTKVYDTYGCAEGVQIAAQCEYGNYHLHALDALVEYLDDEGQTVSPGTIGNIVVTRLHSGPMPLIRYAIGDLGVQSNLNNCPCGRGFPLMQSIQGRSADNVITPSGNRLLVHYFTGILEHFSVIDSFQVVQQTPNSIIIRLVPNGEIDKKMSVDIINALKEKGCYDLDIHLQVVEEIPLLPSGKRKFVISEISGKVS